MESVEVVIVGAGVTGLAAAWRLAEAGRETLVLDRFPLGHDRGSSHGATRIFRFAYDDPDYVRMAQAALPLWRELEESSGAELLRITGGVDVGDPPYLDRLAAALTSCGAIAERLDGRERAARYPWLDAGDALAVASPDAGVLAAARALEAMAAAAGNGGAEIRATARCERIELADDGVTLSTASGEIAARRCIVAAGAWTGPLVQEVGVRFPVTVTCEQVFYFHGTEDVVPFIHRDGIARYGVPAFFRAPGVKVAEHGTGERTSADGRSFDMDPEGAARVSAYVADALPSFDSDPVGFETCLYTTTPDEDFVIDRIGPLIVASPCSGHGFKFAPVVGEALAALATGRAPAIPLERFAISRFG